jgi:peptide/nickel transport system substrate-binding protein
MNRTHADELDRVRHASGELQNHIIDELAVGHLNRRQFVRRASIAGLSATSIGAVLAACGSANSSGKASSGPSGAAPAATGKKGGTMRVGQLAPVASMNPLTVSDAGGLNLLAQVGEYLTFDNDTTQKLEPMLATKWSPNGDGTVWTFHLRNGVKFHNGQTMSADDVVYTFKQISDPHNASNALSTLGGILTPDGVTKVDSSTVRFHLHGPNGNFPYLVSSDNYNAIIVPAGTDYGKWQKTWIGTGAFKYASYSANNGASFRPNHDYWGPKPLLSQTKFEFYGSQQPQVLALQGGQVDLLNGIVPQGAEAILSSSQYKVFGRKSSGHREISMRCDRPPFNDARVRRAVALTLNRPGMISSLMAGHAALGNDSPFAPKFPSTDLSVPQRKQDIAQAKALLKAAGKEGLSVDLHTTNGAAGMVELATVFAKQAKEAGVNVTVRNDPNYYGDSYLKLAFSVDFWGTRGYLNQVQQGSLPSAPYNETHWPPKTGEGSNFEDLYKQALAATDDAKRIEIEQQMQKLEYDLGGYIIPFFGSLLDGYSSKVHGLTPSKGTLNLATFGHGFRTIWFA